MTTREQLARTHAPVTHGRPHPATASPTQMQAMADAGPQAGRLNHLQAAADRSPQVAAQAAMQRAAPEEEEPLQARAVQRAEQEGGELEEEEPMQARAVQRAAVEEEEPLQGHALQRAEDEGSELEEEEPVQARAIQREAQAAARPNRTGMPDGLKSGIEALSGHDMSDVRVHSNSSKPAQVGAHAYAQGSDIHVGPGQEKHLPHEAWHVVQQRQGRVRPTLQAHGVAINDDRSLEQEADVMGAKALQRQAAARGSGPA